MDAVEFLRAKSRMTRNCKISCSSCPLDYCMTRSLEEQVEIVEKWSVTHSDTKQSKFLKLFPNANMENNVLDICPRLVDTAVVCKTVCDSCVRDYWLAEVEEDE